jgi:hypothetical protein
VAARVEQMLDALREVLKYPAGTLVQESNSHEWGSPLRRDPVRSARPILAARS